MLNHSEDTWKKVQPSLPIMFLREVETLAFFDIVFVFVCFQNGSCCISLGSVEFLRQAMLNIKLIKKSSSSAVLKYYHLLYILIRTLYSYECKSNSEIPGNKDVQFIDISTAAPLTILWDATIPLLLKTKRIFFKLRKQKKNVTLNSKTSYHLYTGFHCWKNKISRQYFQAQFSYCYIEITRVLQSVGRELGWDCHLSSH